MKKTKKGATPSIGAGKLNPVSLARGAGLSAVAAVVAAVIWAGLIWVTWDWPDIIGGIINVAGIFCVGSLAGVGMAAGHEDDDGRLAD